MKRMESEAMRDRIYKALEQYEYRDDPKYDDWEMFDHAEVLYEALSEVYELMFREDGD